MATYDIDRLAIIGDSNTVGYGVPDGQGYAALLEAERPEDNVLPLAYLGADVRVWLTVYANDLNQLANWAPITVLIALGANDWHQGRRPNPDFIIDLTYLTWQIRRRVSNARVIYWHYYPIGVPQDLNRCDVWPCTPMRSTWSQYADAMRTAAILNVAGYIDNSVAAPNGRPWSDYYQPDHIHLNADGHQLQYQDIRSRLVNFQ